MRNKFLRTYLIIVLIASSVFPCDSKSGGKVVIVEVETWTRPKSVLCKVGEHDSERTVYTPARTGLVINGITQVEARGESFDSVTVRVDETEDVGGAVEGPTLTSYGMWRTRYCVPDDLWRRTCEVHVEVNAGCHRHGDGDLDCLLACVELLTCYCCCECNANFLNIRNLEEEVEGSEPVLQTYRACCCSLGTMKVWGQKYEDRRLKAAGTETIERL